MTDDTDTIPDMVEIPIDSLHGRKRTGRRVTTMLLWDWHVSHAMGWALWRVLSSRMRE